ncbi:MAG TPA: ABC transporter permease [Actinobacteria bacterium]|nr:ABC transporter permease [Actinomycetota bacterium]
MWVSGLVRRRGARLAGTALGVALAVTILASLGAFFAASKARMTQQAVAGVPVDWQVQLAPATDPTRAGHIVASAPGVTATVPVGYADTTGFKATVGGSQQTTGPGKVLSIPSNYAQTFPGEIRFLVGARTGALLAQQTAANLHAAIGTMVSVGRPGLAPACVRVTGVIDLPFADSMFQKVGAPPGSGIQAPPDNILLLPSDQWHALFDTVAAARPGAVVTQFHVKLSPDLPPDPSAAFASLLARSHNLEAQLSGGAAVGDNVGALIDAARKDAVYAQLLFLFLGLPGAVLAGLVTAVIAGAGAERRRREQSLLRTRGATPTAILRLAGAEALLVGVAGSAVGLVGAAVAGHLAFGASRFGANTGQAVTWGVASALAGLALAALTIVLPAWRDVRKITVRASAAAVGRPKPALWSRLYLDVLALAGSGLLFWQAVRSGYQVVLAPEGVPTISVSYLTLFAPLLLWIGSALFSLRLADLALHHGRRVLDRLSRPVAGGLSGVVAASMSRQRRLLSRALVLMALTASFAVSTAIFNATFAAQSRVDAQLTNGADVSVTTAAAAGLPPDALTKVRSVSGVAAAEPMLHRFAYVGNDLQDLYGIDPTTIGRATTMSNAYFGGGAAAGTLATLAAHPDGVLVSDETVKDFQLQLGDLVRLRLQFVDHAYHIVAFHYVGVAREFPTAPHDSFLVANAAYVAKATGSPGVQTILARTNGSPPVVAAQVRRALGPVVGASVHDVVSELHTTLSGLTAIDLTGLTRLELGFAFVLAAAASGLVLALGLVERRRTFAIASALGAKSRQLGAFVWSEASFVTVGGVILGAVAGWGLSFFLVKILTGVFDPPPEHLFVPWAYLAVVAGVTVGAVVVAAVGALRATHRPAIELVRDL